MPELRGGLIGCGFFARNHIHAWNQLPDAQIVAVCDTDSARAQAFAQDFGVPRTYTDAAQMLQTESLDFVDIVTQPATHRALVELAAAQGVPVICQKPLALALEDARAMVQACANANVPFMVHENFRWQSPMRGLKAAAADIGDLFFGRISFRTPYDVYANQPYLATEPRFIIADLGVHLLDLARFFCGEAEQLTCYAQRVNPHIVGEDAATILLKMRSGATCLVDCSYATTSAEDPFPQTFVHLEGTKGRALLGRDYRLDVDTGGKIIPSVVPPQTFAWSTPPFEAVQESVAAIQRHWIECLRTGATPETSGADNLRTLELVFGAYQSAEQNVPYHIEETA